MEEWALALLHTPSTYGHTFVIQEAEHRQQLLQQTRPTHTVYSGGTRPRGISTIPGHSGFSRSQQPSLPLSTESPHIHINSYIGTATTSLWLNIVFLTPWHIGPK